MRPSVAVQVGLALLAVLLLIAGLTQSGHSHARAHAAAPPGPTVLHAGTPDDTDQPGDEELRTFADRVRALSRGTVVVRVETNADGGVPSGWDQAVARRVERGSLDLGLVPTRAFSRLGVAAMAALQTPFLIRSDSVAAGASRDPVVVSAAFADLHGLHLTGLALVPEGMRTLFGFGRPLVSARSLTGIGIRAPLSIETTALLHAYGARVYDWRSHWEGRIADGTVSGAESSFRLASTLPWRTVGTPLGRLDGLVASGSVPLLAKFSALVIRDASLARLDRTTQAIVRRAASDARDWAIRTRLRFADSVRAF